MPEYLAPGVYVEETSFRAKSIEGVSTSTTAFIGPTRRGPVGGEPVLITSFGDFERIYGGFDNLNFGGTDVPNYIAHAVRSYFDNGGARLFMARVYNGLNRVATSALIGSGEDSDVKIRFISRSQGRAGDASISLSLEHTLVSARSFERAPVGSVIVDGVDLDAEPFGWPSSDAVAIYVRGESGWEDRSGDPFNQGSLDGNEVIVTANVLIRDVSGNEYFYENLGLAAGHPRYIRDVLAPHPDRLVDQLEQPYAMTTKPTASLATEPEPALDGAVGEPEVTPFRLYEILVGIDGASQNIGGGSDGVEPVGESYRLPLDGLAGVDDISIVAAPGYSSFGGREGIQSELLGHAEARRAYRFAVLDTRPGIIPTEALTDKSVIDSSYAALYYPWVVVSNPLSRPDDASIPREIALPPSGFICGIFARNDISRSVAKSPGNEVVRGALRFERNISHPEQELLNPRGVNCLRFFPGRGYRLWGARTASSDPEWKYVGPRRFFLYLERSIDRSTQWAVFENNGPRLWANIREAVSSFLYNEWRSGNLLGTTPEEAFFVRCDRSTMTQNDLDNGRLICLIGVAVLKPAEFVVFRIGQKTIEARD